MTFSDEPNDGNTFESDYDPLVAEQFAKLERVRVPELDTSVRPLPVAQLQAAPARRFDPLYAMAIVAAFFVIAAASFVALRPSSDLDLDATNDGEGGDIEANEDGSAAVEDGDGGSLTVEVTPSSTAATDGSGGQTQQGEDSSSNDGVTDSAGEGSSSTVAAGSGSQMADSSTTSTTVQTTETTGGGTTPSSIIDLSTVLKPPSTKPGPPITTPDIPTTTFGSDGPAENRVAVQGTLTEVFTDCSAHYVLNEAGESESVGPVSCDGGSYIVVDDVMIRTSSGYVPSDLYYDRHNPALRPGQRVVVSATAASQAPAALTLNCAQCGISLGG